MKKAIKSKDEPGTEVRVLRDNEFIQEFSRRPNDEYWRKVEVIQTCVKAKTGCGEPVFVNFVAPLDADLLEEEIDYDYKTLPADLDLLKHGEDQAYAQKQCLKLCYYIQKVYGYEVLRMRADFFKDSNGYIWFFYAHDISWRESLKKNATSGQEA